MANMMGGPGPGKNPWQDARSSAMTRGAPPTQDAAAGMSEQGSDDAETGYVETSGGPKCGNCLHMDQSTGTCPVVQKTVSAANGCCNSWDDGSGQPGIKPQDAGMEAGMPAQAPAAMLSAPPSAPLKPPKGF